MIEVVSYISALILSDSKIMNDRFKQRLTSIEIYFLFKNSIMNKIHKFRIFVLKIKFLPLNEISFIPH